MKPRRVKRWGTLAACSVVAIGLGWPHLLPVAAQSVGNGNAPPKEIRGEPIARSLPVPSKGSNAPSVSPSARALMLDQPDRIEGEFIRLSFDKLSTFDYDVFEVYAETNAGRPLLKSTNTIPPQIKAYDGKRVTLSGFVLPLRTRNRLVSEFLLLRRGGADQPFRASKTQERRIFTGLAGALQGERRLSRRRKLCRRLSRRHLFDGRRERHPGRGTASRPLITFMKTTLFTESVKTHPRAGTACAGGPTLTQFTERPTDQ